jgi:hypothetical protein
MIMSDNKSHQAVTEQELKAKATGRRVTLEDVHASIVSEHYFTAGQGDAKAMEDAAFVNGALNGAQLRPVPAALELMTFCVLVLKNGFTVTGQSACADPANYNEEIGQRIAKSDAIGKIWPLLGFALREDIHREQELLDGRAIKISEGWDVFVGTKVIHAIPMSRAVYNDFRGWVMPADEEDDAGYLVEYTDGGKPNVANYGGYLSWSPKDIFERAYRTVGADGASAAQPRKADAGPTASGSYAERVRIELNELEDKITKLNAFTQTSAFFLLPKIDQSLMLSQSEYMNGYRAILKARVARLD